MPASASRQRGTLTTQREGTAHAAVTLAGDRTGVAEERPDGSLVLLPDTSVDAIRKRMGARPATLEEFEAEHGPLGAPDGAA